MTKLISPPLRLFVFFIAVYRPLIHTIMYVDIIGEKLPIKVYPLLLQPLSWDGVFSGLHLLWHGTSGFKVSPKDHQSY